ncbi:hypothetical protein [Enterococcus sp. AZ180]|uniref:hypothetical protein n=1 Tax=Enterococcus sp. AZ180 TaxID=2774961 RepID=UPI003F265ADF
MSKEQLYEKWFKLLAETVSYDQFSDKVKLERLEEQVKLAWKEIIKEEQNES